MRRDMRKASQNENRNALIMIKKTKKRKNALLYRVAHYNSKGSVKYSGILPTTCQAQVCSFANYRTLFATTFPAKPFLCPCVKKDSRSRKVTLTSEVDSMHAEESTHISPEMHDNIRNKQAVQLLVLDCTRDKRQPSGDLSDTHLLLTILAGKSVGD